MRLFNVLARGVALIAGLGGHIAAASDGQSLWANLASQTYSAPESQVYDHSFARQWEANPPKGFPTLSPRNIDATKAAIQRYTDIVARGGWKQIPDVQMQIGSTGAAVGLLKERLTLSGDLRDGGAGFFAETFGADLERAVKRFQASNGLTPTGIVDRRTVSALNVPAADRLKQLKVNLTRLQELVRGQPKKYVVVNIPSAQVEAIEDDQVALRHAGVVGKIDRQSPILKSAIHELNFNPVWHLPPTVIEKDLIPKGIEMARRGQNVLAKYGVEAFDAEGRKIEASRINWASGAARGLTFRQQPGPENPLGFVKINFHNAHSVYMHDSPSQNLFGRNFRAASSGCIRIHGVEHLAAWLAADQGWSKEQVLEMKKTGERKDLQLKRPVALYWTYITAWATEDGVIHFRRDIYNKDGVSQAASAY